MVTDGPVDDEVSGAVDGEEKVTESTTDIKPNRTVYTTTVKEVFVELHLVEILG